MHDDDGPTQHQPAAVRQVRVLIVDDNQSFTELLAAALDTVDGVVCVGTASSAAEGFRKAAELNPTVVMMDIMMPGLDGLAATTEMRRTSPDTAVAVVSAHSQGEWVSRAADAGASAYIPKGGSLTEVIEVLRAARPGPMIVASSLQATWSAYGQPEPATEAVPDQPPSRARRSRLAELIADRKQDRGERQVRRPL